MKEDAKRLHVFAAAFSSEADALRYAHEQWEPEPTDAPDSEYAAWEARNPSWRLKEELGCVYLDSDLVETIWSERGGIDWSYLASVLQSSYDVERCRRAAPPRANTLILIQGDALGGFACAFKSTQTVTYCGGYLRR